MYLKGKSHLVAREYKDAVGTFKNLDLDVIIFLEF
jgi:hypothetical protein